MRTWIAVMSIALAGASLLLTACPAEILAGEYVKSVTPGDNITVDPPDGMGHVVISASGEPGPQGEKGDKGDKGDQGDQGEQGPAGERGSVGPEGPQGPEAPQGPRGPEGLIGPRGETGGTGATGPQGPEGPEGSEGPAGPGGPQGPRGETGATGATGPQGPEGPEGPQGPAGPEGPQGPPNETGAFTTLSVSAPAATADPVTITGGLYTGSDSARIIDVSRSIENTISDNALFDGQHNSLQVTSDFTGAPIGKTMISKVFGNMLTREGTLDGYGSSCAEQNYAQRNWIESSSIFAADENSYGVENYAYSSILRDKANLTDAGQTLSVKDWNIHIDSDCTAVETAGTLNIDNVGLYVEQVLSGNASVTNGTLNTYGIYFGTITGHPSGETYSIKDASTRDWMLGNQKIYFDSTDTYIYANTDDPEDLVIGADQDIILEPDNAVIVTQGLVIPSGTTPAPATEGALFLDTDAGGNGVLVMYANGGWRTVASL